MKEEVMGNINKKFILKYLAIIFIFLVLTSGKTVILNTRFPNSNYLIEEHIKMYYGNLPFDNGIDMDDVRVIDKVNHADRLAVLYDFEEEGDTKKAIIIYSLSEHGKLMGSKGIRTIDSRFFDPLHYNDDIPFRAVTVEEGFKDILFIFGKNDDGHNKAHIEHLNPYDGNVYEVTLEDGYFMKFVDSVEMDQWRVKVRFAD